MQHVVEHLSPPHATEPTHQPQPASAMIPAATSPSSASSPKSQKASINPAGSQVSQSTLASNATLELTPPSSVASTQEQNDVNKHLVEGVTSGEMLEPSVAGKKRTANGQVKDGSKSKDGTVLSNVTGNSQSIGTTSPNSNASLGEISQQLRTKLTYAMLKVQNGWQKHSLDEIESIASQSPRSTLSGHPQRDFQSLVSPRIALAAGARQNSNTSSLSDHSIRYQATVPPSTTSTILPLSSDGPMTSPQRKGLAPPAPIISGNRRRPTPNVHLHINSSLKPHSKSARPLSAQRTPSQNAAMEADAVETLLFMSASPNNSGHFPSHLSAYSPTSQAFSTQSSPLKAHFSVHDQNLPTNPIGYSPRSLRRRSKFEDKTALIDRLLNDLDDDESEELDVAVRIIEQHRAAKMLAKA